MAKKECTSDIEGALFGPTNFAECPTAVTDEINNIQTVIIYMYAWAVDLRSTKMSVASFGALERCPR